MSALLLVLFLAPRVTVSAAEKSQAVREYADVIVELAGGNITIVEVRRGKFDKPTQLPRFRGRFEARALRGKHQLEQVAFDFPLYADAETDDFGEDERKLAAKMRAGVKARTRVRVPLPEGADVIQLYDTKSARAITVPLKAPEPAQSPGPAVREGAPRAP